MAQSLSDRECMPTTQESTLGDIALTELGATAAVLDLEKLNAGEILDEVDLELREETPVRLHENMQVDTRTQHRQKRNCETRRDMDMRGHDARREWCNIEALDEKRLLRSGCNWCWTSNYGHADRHAGPSSEVQGRY